MARWTFTVDQEVRESIRYYVNVEAETEAEARGQIELGDWDDSNHVILSSKVLDQTETLKQLDGEPVEDDADTDDVYDDRGLRRMDAPLD